jgi:hypothetical protein
MGHYRVYLTTGESRMTKTLEELKKENKAAEEQEELNANVKTGAAAEEPKVEVAAVEEPKVVVDVDDDDDDDDGVDKEPALWMDTDDPDKKADKDYVPVGAHVEMKNKLRGRLSEKDDELVKIRAENAALKARQTPERKLRPNPDDYTDQEKFDRDLDEFKDWDANDRMHRIRMRDEQSYIQAKNKALLDERVDAHYDRASSLLAKSGIAPELFKHADQKVRKTIDSLRPGMGDVIADSFISTLGDGSEKVMYYLGVNEVALNKLQALLVDDPTGLRAAVYLGQEKQRLTTPTKHRSNAPAPSKSINGDVNSGNAKGLKRKYEAAHKSGDLQLAYNLKQQAKKEGSDVKIW